MLYEVITLLPWLIGLLCLFVLLPLLNQSRQWLHGRLAERVQTSMQDHLHRVVTALPFELFDRGQHYRITSYNVCYTKLLR